MSDKDISSDEIMKNYNLSRLDLLDLIVDGKLDPLSKNTRYKIPCEITYEKFIDGQKEFLSIIAKHKKDPLSLSSDPAT